jgi:hypothetical protein
MSWKFAALTIFLDAGLVVRNERVPLRDTRPYAWWSLCMI